MDKKRFRFFSKSAILILCSLGLIELGLALWTILEDRYKSLAYNLADVGYIDLWVLRYLSMCLFASSIITLVMCLILVWGLYATKALLFISATMIALVAMAQFVISILTLTNKFLMRMILQDQLPKLVITYRQGNDERANRALDILQMSFRCCGSDGRLSYQNNVPLSCNMFSIGCSIRTMYFLDSCMDVLASILFIFSIVKFLIVLFFYTLLCVNHRNHQKTSDRDSHSMNQSSEWRRSSSFDSSSSENLPKKILLSSMTKTHSPDEIDKRRVILNDYESQLTNKRVQNAAPLFTPIEKSLADQQVLRKLSSISEKTERGETDGSESDPLRLKRPAIITAVHQQKPSLPPPLPKKLPMIKNRPKSLRETDNDNDSGVEHSSSEKSFDGQPIGHKRRPTTPTSTSIDSANKSLTKSVPTLSFSNVFVTSVSQPDIKQSSLDGNMKKSSTGSSLTSSYLSDPLLLPDVATPKPILKKSPLQSSPLSDQYRIPPSYNEQKRISAIVQLKSSMKLIPVHLDKPPMKSIGDSSIPKPAPRPSLKQQSSSSLDRHEPSLV